MLSGKSRKQQLQIAKLITKERATRLEDLILRGETQFRLKKIKAKTKKTEILWIFFGIHTANCLEIGRRMQQQVLDKVA